MKLKCSFECIELDKEIIGVPVGDGASKIHGVLKLNNEGREILNLLSEETTEEEIVLSLSNNYENTKSDLRKKVDHFISKLRLANLLDEQ